MKEMCWLQPSIRRGRNVNGRPNGRNPWWLLFSKRRFQAMSLPQIHISYRLRQ